MEEPRWKATAWAVTAQSPGWATGLKLTCIHARFAEDVECMTRSEFLGTAAAKAALACESDWQPVTLRGGWTCPLWFTCRSVPAQQP
jgi:hypothetical protein